VSSDHTEQVLEVAGTHLQLLKGGSGEALLVLHGAGGNPGWLPYHQELATHFTVYAPSHPGYGQSARLDWITTINDMAHFYRQLIEELGLVLVHVLGFSMGGGWEPRSQPCAPLI
jgi:pimeloyl-ACP methyl ester carboxylesterase